MGIGSETILGASRTLDKALDEVKKIVEIAFKDKTHRMIEDATGVLSTRILNSLNN